MKARLSVALVLGLSSASTLFSFGCSEAPGTDGSGGTGGARSGDGAASGTGSTGSLGTGGSGSGGTSGAGGSAGASGGSGEAGGTGGSGVSGFSPCPASGTCKILPLGDSITDGFGVPGGYRIPLYGLTLDANKDITFIGRASNGPEEVDGEPFPKNHEGYSGYTIAQLNGSPANIPEQLSDTPHIVLLHIGTNDMIGADAGTAPTRLGALLDELTETWPDALIVVAQLIPFPFAQAAVDTYNDAVPGMVAAKASAGAHVILVDQGSDFPANGVDADDTVHPNETGYAAMADVWYAAIGQYLP